MNEVLESAAQWVLPEVVQVVLLFISAFCVALVFWEERRVRIGLFGRYVEPGLDPAIAPAATVQDQHEFELEVQNFEDRDLDGPIFMHFQLHTERPLQPELVQLDAFAGPSFGDIHLVQGPERGEVVVRVDGIRALKTLGFRLVGPLSAVSLWASGDDTSKPGGRSRPRHLRVSRWPAELRIVTGDHASTRRVTRSPSWALFVWCALAAVSAYLAVRSLQGGRNYEIDGVLVGAICLYGAAVFWWIRREAMPVARGYLRAEPLLVACRGQERGGDSPPLGTPTTELAPTEVGSGATEGGQGGTAGVEPG